MLNRLTRVMSVGLLFVPTTCSDHQPTSPFDGPPPVVQQRDGGLDAGASPDDGLIDDVDGPSSVADLTLGGPCADDGQCDDGVECTFDRCDQQYMRCRFTPDDSVCQDDLYCNGVEVCGSRGCRAGEVVTCDDGTSCTIDRCVEAEGTCQHEERDADRDGDVDARCGGTDCDEGDPSIAGIFEEICGNQRDDDCDRQIDEEECEAPLHDTCDTALEVTASGTYPLRPFAASSDIAASCSTTAQRDLVVEVVTERAHDVLFTVTAPTGAVGIARFERCGSLDTERQCRASSTDETGLQVARLLARDLPEGRHAFVVYSDGLEELEAQVELNEATSTPSNETCGTAAMLLPGVSTVVDLRDALPDVQSQCGEELADRVYRFELDQPSDVRVFAAPSDGFGRPSVSLRGADCVNDELRCAQGEGAELYYRALPAGEHSLAVSTTVPSLVDLLLQVSPETAVPAGDNCEAAPELAAGTTLNIDTRDFADDLNLGCLASGRDAVLRLSLEEPADVLLIARLSAGDHGAVGLAPIDACEEQAALGCVEGTTSPLRLARHRLLAGSYAVVVESQLGAPVQVMALVRKAAPPTLATHAEDCETVVDIPPQGGFFQGNTNRAVADFSGSCDVRGATLTGAGDQLLRLVLTDRRRVILDMSGSAFNTLLDLREGPECPGTEVRCAASTDSGRSYIDMVLEPAEYYVQLDGYAGGEGQWFLEVFSLEP